MTKHHSRRNTGRTHRRAPSRRGRMTRVACRMCLQLHEMRAGQRRGACEVPRGQARGSTSSTSSTSGTSHHGGAICPSAVPLPPAPLHVRSGVRQPIASAPSDACRAGVSRSAAQPSRQRARLDRNMQQTACNVQQVACNVQQVACNVQQAACNVQQAACNRQHATHNVQWTTCNTQQTAWNVRAGRRGCAAPPRGRFESAAQRSAAQRSAAQSSAAVCCAVRQLGCR